MTSSISRKQSFFFKKKPTPFGRAAGEAKQKGGVEGPKRMRARKKQQE
jgi:hypothetical protein